MKKRISKVLAIIIVFALIVSLIPMEPTNISYAATYLGKFSAEEFENITIINKDLEGNISSKQAMKIASSVYSNLYYFHDSNFERSNGERYYVITIKDKVENHYTSLTQLFISFDGEICVEGYTSDQKIYVYNGDNLLVRTKVLQAYSKILLQKENLNENEDDLKTHFSICDFNSDGVQDLILSKEEHILSEKKYYTFENGKVVEIEGPNDTYPIYGYLYVLPSRGTYAFYRSGPGSEDENGNGYMPHIIMEYKLENYKIKLINDFYWVEYQFGNKAGLNEYSLNGKECTAENYQNIYNSFGNQIEFYPNSEINRMYWGVNDSGDFGDEEGKQKKSIAVFTTNKSMRIKTGKSMWMGFGLLDKNSGLLDDKWEKMSLAVSDPTVISLSDYTETEYGYSLEVIGKKQGATNITITDTESGINTIITVFVQDDYVNTYSYSIDNIAPFYPNNAFENNIETNIYDLNGLYVNKYQCTKSTNSYNVSFDIYNSKSMSLS